MRVAEFAKLTQSQGIGHKSWPGQTIPAKLATGLATNYSDFFSFTGRTAEI